MKGSIGTVHREVVYSVDNLLFLLIDAVERLLQQGVLLTEGRVLVQQFAVLVHQARMVMANLERDIFH